MNNGDAGIGYTFRPVFVLAIGPSGSGKSSATRRGYLQQLTTMCNTPIHLGACRRTVVIDPDDEYRSNPIYDRLLTGIYGPNKKTSKAFANEEEQEKQAVKEAPPNWPLMTKKQREKDQAIIECKVEEKKEEEKKKCFLHRFYNQMVRSAKIGTTFILLTGIAPYALSQTGKKLQHAFDNQDNIIFQFASVPLVGRSLVSWVRHRYLSKHKNYIVKIVIVTLPLKQLTGARQRTEHAEKHRVPMPPQYIQTTSFSTMEQILLSNMFEKRPEYYLKADEWFLVMRWRIDEDEEKEKEKHLTKELEPLMQKRLRYFAWRGTNLHVTQHPALQACACESVDAEKEERNRAKVDKEMWPRFFPTRKTGKWRALDLFRQDDERVRLFLERKSGFSKEVQDVLLGNPAVTHSNINRFTLSWTHS